MSIRSGPSARRRCFTLAGAAVMSVALSAFAGIQPASALNEPVPEVTFRVAGLEREVAINIDSWGVPHIFAKTVDDAFLAQGFNAARDRLFQIDLAHRRGLGKLSEVFGPAYVAQDRATRLFLYRGDLDAEWAAYGADAKQTAARFAAGVNAYIDWVTRNPAALPPEFRMLNYLPDKWTAEDVVRIRTHALVSGLQGEVARAQLACAGGLDLDPLRRRLQPDHTAAVPDGLDPCLPAGVLDVYNLATATVRFTGNTASPLAVEATDNEDPGFEEGSNNWTVAGSRTTTGRPILANDPHRAQQAPSLRYIAQISAPGMNVIGAGEPALPGISIGHNDSIAFGLTVFGIDAQDLYIYDLNEANTHYRYRDTWQDFENVREEIAVRDGGPQAATLQYTRHGPVIYVDETKHKAYAVRSTWSLPGASAYFASISYMRARNWSEFLDAMTRWGTPGENQVYADVQGNIGWKPGGFAPRRIGYDGLLPVPGDGRYEWDAIIPGPDLPQVFNPSEGFFATANQFNLPPGTPTQNVTSYEWSGPDRHRRIVEALGQDDRHSLQDSAALQTDVLSPRARDIVDMVRPLSSTDPLTARALAFVATWNGAQNLGSTQATLYLRYWQSRINSAVRAALISPERRDLIGSVDWLVVMDVLHNPTEWLGPDGAAIRDRILLSSLRAAYAAAESALGPDTSAWGFTGNARTMPHPLGSIDPTLNVGPFPIPGSDTTPIASGNASYRQIIDVGNWDASLAINTPGQSGVPTSEHYRDLAPLWAQGQYFPLLFSRSAVEQHTESRIILIPA